MALLQDLLLGCHVRAHDATRVYDAAHAGKNQVLEQRNSVFYIGYLGPVWLWRIAQAGRTLSYFLAQIT